MDKKDEFIFLKEEVENKITLLKQKIDVHKKKSILLRVITITAGALVTVALGLEIDESYQSFQNNLALVLGALITLSSGVDGALNSRGNWIRLKTTLLSMYQLQNEIRFFASKDSYDEIDNLFEKYQQIWEQDSSSWLKIVRKSPEKSS